MESVFKINLNFTDIINLGRYCQVSVFLKNKFEFYKPSLFDNLWSDDLEMMPDLIKCGFSNFFDRDNVKEKGKNPFGSYTVVDELNKNISVHDIKDRINNENWNIFKNNKNELALNTFNRL